MKVLAAFFLLAVASCDNITNPNLLPESSSCVEFDHVTRRGDKLTSCRMVWYEKYVGHWTGGIATLWCDSSPNTDGGTPCADRDGSARYRLSRFYATALSCSPSSTASPPHPCQQRWRESGNGC